MTSESPAPEKDRSEALGNSERDPANTEPLSAWERVFGFDSRSLALFRFGLGLLVLLDVTLRWPDIPAMYTDDGYFSRSLMRLFYTTLHGPDVFTGTWSLHAWYGDASWQHLLFGLQGICGVLLMLGLFTRPVTLAAWLLVASLQFRNPLIITSGDFILKLMLFWSLFLPLARHASLDGWLHQKMAKRPHPPEPSWIVHFGTAGFLLQMILMYFFTGIAKWNEIWWSGDAMYYVLNLDIYVRPLGKQLLQHEWLLRGVTWATLIVEVFGIWLLLVPSFNTLWRCVLIAIYWSFHLGIALTMAIGWFPLICIVVWLPLIPSAFWNRFSGTERAVAREWRLVGWRKGFRAVANAFCAIMLGVVLVWNLANIRELGLTGRIPLPIVMLGKVTAIDQFFQMFGTPPKTNPWFVYEARLADGSKVDLFHPKQTLHHEAPPNGIRAFPSHSWRKLHRNMTEIVDERLQPLRQTLLDYQVGLWNAAHPDSQAVVSAKLIAYARKTGPDAEAENITSAVWATWHRAGREAGSLFDDLEDRLNSGDSFPF